MLTPYIYPVLFSVVPKKQGQTELTLSTAPIKLHQLDLIQKTDDESAHQSVKVIATVASKWDKIALRLHFDHHDIERIRKDNSQSEQACQKMFCEWIDGKGRKPTNWSTLIKALEEAEYSKLASDIKTVLFNH